MKHSDDKVQKALALLLGFVRTNVIFKLPLLVTLAMGGTARICCTIFHVV